MTFTEPAEILPTEKLPSPLTGSGAVVVMAMFATLCPVVKFSAEVRVVRAAVPDQSATYPAAVGPVTVTLSATAVASAMEAGGRSSRREWPEANAELRRVSTRRVGDCGW